VEWNSLNDFTFSNNEIGSVFNVLVDKHGACISTSSPYTIFIRYFRSDGTEINELSFTGTYYATGDQMELGVAIRFGEAEYAEVSAYCVADNREQSNTLTFTLKRPEGAF
jgi:hypothetical protein